MKYLKLPVLLALGLGIILGFFLNKNLSKISQKSVNNAVTATLSTTSTPPPIFLEKAVPLKIGYRTQGTLTSGKSTDLYYFMVDTDANIRISFKNLPTDYSTYLYDSNKQIISSSNRHGVLESQAIIHIPTPGKYYLQVITDYNEPTNLPYTVNVSVLPFFE